MPAKKTSKSRTSKSKLNKKSKVPNGVIGLVLLIVAGTGAFLVYNSFAYVPNSTGYVWCKGWCTETYQEGAWVHPKSECTFRGSFKGRTNQWTCPNSRSY